jgi:hypothetical protein
MAAKIDNTLFEKYLEKNNTGKVIRTELGIDSANYQLLETEGSICSYLIKHLEFMAIEVFQYYNADKARGKNDHDFYYSQYNIKIDHTGKYTKKVVSFTYPLPIINSLPFSTHYSRSIYQNVCDILRIVAQFNKPATSWSAFHNSKEYIDIFDGRASITDIHRNFAGFIHEYCIEFKNEITLLELCKDKILPYIINDKNEVEVNNLISKLDKIIQNLKKQPSGAAAAAFNIHDLI